MAFLGIDLGGTKLSLAVFTLQGEMLCSEKIPIDGRKGPGVGQLICGEVANYLHHYSEQPIEAIGISVPGISRHRTGTVWAPNLPGWDDYPLLREVEAIAGEVPVTIDSDRACYILGEQWQGAAKGAKDAIYLAVGTGIGAGILVSGNVLRGAHDIAGAIGWLALGRPFEEKYRNCGFFEYHASGDGIAKVARELRDAAGYGGELANIPAHQLTAAHVFRAYEKGDRIGVQVIRQCIAYWGMAAANLISLFNPETIIFGGGVFGPATVLLPAIKEEAQMWAQPISVTQVSFLEAALGEKSGVYGAGFLAIKSLSSHYSNGAYA